MMVVRIASSICSRASWRQSYRKAGFTALAFKCCHVGTWTVHISGYWVNMVYVDKHKIVLLGNFWWCSCCRRRRGALWTVDSSYLFSCIFSATRTPSVLVADAVVAAFGSAVWIDHWPIIIFILHHHIFGNKNTGRRGIVANLSCFLQFYEFPWVWRPACPLCELESIWEYTHQEWHISLVGEDTSWHTWWCFSLSIYFEPYVPARIAIITDYTIIVLKELLALVENCWRFTFAEILLQEV